MNEEFTDAPHIRELVDRTNQFSDDYSASRARAELDRIADEHRFGGLSIDCDDGAERDEVIGMLAGSGSESFAQYMYGD